MSMNREQPVNLGSTLLGPKSEWPSTLDVRTLLMEGWKPTPFREFVLKVHSRCNLACDYCYMYELADKTWRLRPRRMSRAIAEQAVTRIAEHIHTHHLTQVTLSLH